MRLSKHLLEEMGYKEYSADEILEATFHLIKVYAIQGFVFDELEEIQQTNSIKFGQICTAIIGSSVNAISNTLLEDDFVGDEEGWKKESKTSSPFLFLHFGPTKPYQIKGGFRKKENGIIQTYDCFPDAKKQLNSWENEFLTSIMTSVSVEFSSPGKPVNFVPICHEVFAKTSAGVALYDDSSHQMSATAYVSKKIKAEQFNSLLFESSELYCKLDTKISRYFCMGLEEEDKFKQFLYFFLFIERYTHHVFKNIDHDKYSKELMNIPIRLKELALESSIERRDSKNLAQHFHWCSIFVWKNIVDEDIKKFKKLKDIRNKISHGEDIKEVELPVVIARELALKLLKGSNHADKS
jgi:hypothetical protein